MELALSVIRERNQHSRKLEKAVEEMDTLAAKAMAEPDEMKRIALLKQITSRAGTALLEERSFDSAVSEVQERAKLLM
jgi:hypothetical protein